MKGVRSCRGAFEPLCFQYINDGIGALQYERRGADGTTTGEEIRELPLTRTSNPELIILAHPAP
jgi:hypothetical protein